LSTLVQLKTNVKYIHNIKSLKVSGQSSNSRYWSVTMRSVNLATKTLLTFASQSAGPWYGLTLLLTVQSYCNSTFDKIHST